MAERTMPPASKANSRSLNFGSWANRVRRMWTYSCADFFRSSGSWILIDGVHRAGVGGVGGRPVGCHADLGEDELEVLFVDRLA